MKNIHASTLHKLILSLILTSIFVPTTNLFATGLIEEITQKQWLEKQSYKKLIKKQNQLRADLEDLRKQHIQNRLQQKILDSGARPREYTQKEVVLFGKQAIIKNKIAIFCPDNREEMATSFFAMADLEYNNGFERPSEKIKSTKKEYNQAFKRCFALYVASNSNNDSQKS